MNKRKSIRILLLTAVLLAALIAGGCGGKGCSRSSENGNVPEVVIPPTDPSVTGAPAGSAAPVITAEPAQTTEAAASASPEAETPQPTTAPSGELNITRLKASVTAIKTGTYGVGNDGSIRFIGRATAGQNLIYDWDDVACIAANDTTAAVLLNNGKILLTGSLKKDFYEAQYWTNVVELAMGEKHLVGLLADGSVVACGSNSAKQCAVDGWKGVVRIAAGDNFTLGLTKEGVLMTLGNNVSEAINGTAGNPVAYRAADIAAAGERIVVLRGNGTVEAYSLFGFSSGSSSGDYTTQGNTRYYSWSGIVRVFASAEGTFAVDNKGDLYTDSSLITKKLKDVYCVSASEKHAVVLHGDGTCEGFGSNKELQCSVNDWRLLPYVTSDGWLIGAAFGEDINGVSAATGKSVTYTEPATGKTRNAVCVILGDVNGDGAIDEKDSSAVEAHISGKKKLSGAALRAANVIKDSSKPDSVDVLDLYLIESGRVNNYGVTDEYTALLADAMRKNSDALGYIKLSGTNISYPIMYDREWFYNDHDIDRKEAVRGSIYFYWDKPCGNIVITGHNARSSGTMFHQLHNIQNNKKELSTYKNRVWRINAYGETGWWEVWAMYEEGRFKKAEDSSLYYNTNWPKTFDSLSKTQKKDWIDYQLAKSELDISVKVYPEDRFMTLVTCGDSHADSAYGARLYIFLRWVGGER